MQERKDAEIPEGARRLLVDYDAAGAILSISRREVERMVATGRLRVVAVGRLKRIPVVELERWIEAEARYVYEHVTPNLVALRRREPRTGEGGR